MADKPTPSPYFHPDDPAGTFKARLISHLEKLRLPHTRRHSKQPCNKECHLLEREHMVEVITQFVREN